MTAKTVFTKKEIAPFLIDEVFSEQKKLKVSVNFRIIVAVLYMLIVALSKMLSLLK